MITQTFYKEKLPGGLPDHLLRSGYSLASIGANEMAWKWPDILKVIDYVAKLGFAVLGGDVYTIKNNVITPTYDNWHIEKDDLDTWEQYIIASKEKAISYINSYNNRNGSNNYYVIVFSDLKRFIKIMNKQK